VKTEAVVEQAPPAMFVPVWNRSFDSKFVLQLGAYGTSVLLLQGLRFAVSILCARSLAPADWGLWTLLNTVLAYSFIADLGVSNAMNRDIPMFRGRRDLARVASIANLSRSFVLCTSALCMVLAAAYALFAPAANRPVLLVFAVVLFSFKAFTFAQTYSMAHEDFGRVTRSNFALALLTPTVCLPLAHRFGLTGFLCGQIVTFVVGSLLYVESLTKSFRWNLDLSALFSLGRTGAPIAIVGITAALVTSTDRWLVNGFLGVRAVGYYSLVAMTWGAVNILPQVVAARLYPQMASHWGEHASPKGLLRLADRCTLLGLAPTLLVVLGVEAVGPYLVRTLLPRYGLGIAAMRIAALGFLFQPVIYGYANLFNVIGKQQHVVKVQLTSLATAVAISTLLFAHGWGIEAAALGTTIATCLCAAGLYFAAKLTLEQS
jgi:O-antigen/teichoic acid export membrane protein